MQPVGPEVPEAANFGVRVAGDSMEPRFHSGQTVWVHQQPTLDPGEIGVFLYDGSAYLKQLRRDGGRVFLHSLNPAYADLEVSDAPAAARAGKSGVVIKAKKTLCGNHVFRRAFFSYASFQCSSRSDSSATVCTVVTAPAASSSPSSA